MRTAPAFLTGLLVALTLVACVPDDEPVRPDPSPTASPIFASDEEALAAAEAALTAYFEVSDAILRDGGLGSDRLESVSTDDVFSVEKAGHQQLIDRKWHSVGSTTVDTISLQVFDPYAASGAELVTIYACVDISNVDVLDESGVSVISPSRQVRTPFEFGFTETASGSRLLELSRKEAWSGDDFCA